MRSPMEQTAPDRASRLRAAGLKVTGPRLAILEVLESNRRHPSAEDVHRALRGSYPSLSLSTVYMTLEAFVRSGLARRMPELDGRMRVDGFDQPHDHAICRRCGTVFDVARGLGAPPAPPRLLPPGVEVLGGRLEYDVLCASCAGRARGRRPSRIRITEQQEE